MFYLRNVVLATLHITRDTCECTLNFSEATDAFPEGHMCY